MSKRLTGSKVRTALAAVVAVGGLLIYIVSSTTGYLAGRELDPLVLVASIVALVALVVELTAGDRLSAVVRDVLVVGSTTALSVAMVIFLLARVPLAADVYFIPVNFPAAEEATLNLSLVGIGLYLVAVLVLIVEAFAAKRPRPTSGVAFA